MRRFVFPLALIFSLAGLCPAYAQSPKWKKWEVKGDTLFKRENFKGAIQSYSKAISISKLKEKAAYNSLYKRAVSYYNAGAYQEALKDLDVFIPAFPDVAEPKLLKAFIYRELGDSENQLTNLEAVIAQQGPVPELLKWRGLLYLQSSKYNEAKKDLLMARSAQDEPDLETYLGLTYYNLEQKDSAFVSFDRAIVLDATYLPAYIYSGSIALEEGRYELALEYTNLALRLDPKNKEATFYKGVALIELDRKDEGCPCLNRAFYAGMDEAGDYLKQYCFEIED
ncbi:MAG: tetratricopeptide repeat protein [Cyclobacteriaceae bacterium]|nr:tetratricopeptide repeat protein [Cyclobacteriaceae bacterium]